MQNERVLAVLLNEPWLITAEGLTNLISIASRENDLVALESKLGQKLEYAHEATVRDGVAIIPLNGPIFPKANMFTRMSGATSLEMWAQDFQAAEDNPDIHTIISKINSSGGHVTFVDEAYTLVKNSSKRTIAHVSGTGASAAYWIACGHSEIAITPTTQLGSIGVAYAFDKPEGESRRIQIVSTVSPKKRLDPASKEGIASLQEKANDIAEIFVNSVAEARNVSPDVVVTDFGSGDTLIGNKAITAGMADRIITFEQLMAELATEHNKSNNGGYRMNAEELKTKHPEVFAAIYAQGEASQAKTLETELTALRTANAELDKGNAIKDAKIASLEAKVEAMDKAEAIRVAKAQADTVKAEAISVANTAMESTNLPKGLYAKVAGCVSPDNFIKDGIFNANSYAEAVKAEASDWCAQLGDSVIQGFGTNADVNNVEFQGNTGAGSVDKEVDRLLAHIN